MGKLDSPCVCVSELIAEQFHYSGWKGAGLPAKNCVMSLAWALLWTMTTRTNCSPVLCTISCEGATCLAGRDASSNGMRDSQYTQGYWDYHRTRRGETPQGANSTRPRRLWNSRTEVVEGRGQELTRELSRRSPWVGIVKQGE